MEPQSQVFDIVVDVDGEAHKATYYVENNVIHAMINGRVMVSPVGVVPAAETVKSLLMGQLLQNRRRHDQRRQWTSDESAQG